MTTHNVMCKGEKHIALFVELLLFLATVAKYMLEFQHSRSQKNAPGVFFISQHASSWSFSISTKFQWY